VAIDAAELVVHPETARYGEFQTVLMLFLLEQVIY